MPFLLMLCSALIWLVPNQAGATAVASLYNGEQYEIDGVMLVQAADQPDTFFIMPKEYHLVRTSKWDSDLEERVYSPPVHHQTESVDGQTYGIYTMTFDLDVPGAQQRLVLGMKLRRFHPNAQIAGLVPICGVKLDLLGINLAMVKETSQRKETKATTIRYSLNSTEGDKCKAQISPTRFSVTYRVPIENDQSVRAELESESGLVLPPVELVIRNKYTDKITLKINKRRTIEQLKGLADLKGSLKMIKASVNAGIEDLIRRSEVAGDLHINCENINGPACQAFLEYVKSQMIKDLLVIKPEKPEGNIDRLVVGDSGKDVDASIFSVGLAFDSASVKDEEVFTFGFRGEVYDAIGTQVQLRANRVRF